MDRPTPFDLCDRSTITVKCFGETDEADVCGWSYGRYAAHFTVGDPSFSTITERVSGLGLTGMGALFKELENAVKAMIEIEDAFPGGFPKDGLKVFDICKRHESSFDSAGSLLAFIALQTDRGAFE